MTGLLEQWIEMEQFYFQDMTLLIVLGIILLLAVLITLFHLKVKKARRVFIGSLIGLILLGSYIMVGLNKHQPLIDKLSYENAAVRRYKKAPFMTFPYSHTERQIYRVGYMKSSFENIGLYQATHLKDEVTYLGSSDRYVYFDMGHQVFYTGRDSAEFTTETDQAVRVGTQFHLNDPGFEELGFMPESSIFLDGYLVPAAEASKEIDAATHALAVYQNAEDTVRGWVVP